jgi:hypothetical protein
LTAGDQLIGQAIPLVSESLQALVVYNGRILNFSAGPIWS